MIRVQWDESNTHFWTRGRRTDCFGAVKWIQHPLLPRTGEGRQNVSAPVKEVQYQNLTKGGEKCSGDQTISATTKQIQLGFLTKGGWGTECFGGSQVGITSNTEQGGRDTMLLAQGG